MNWFYKSVTLLFCVVFSVSAQDLQRNYADCMAQRISCEPSLLSPAQAQAVLTTLLSKGAPAKPAAPLSEVQQVAQAERENNLRYCKSGSPLCDHGLLTGNEKTTVAQAERENNLRYCKSGSPLCNHGLLTGDEKTTVAQAERENNLRYCKSGSPLCNHGLLTGDEKTTVAQAERENNLQYCKSSSPLCDQALLTGYRAVVATGGHATDSGSPRVEGLIPDPSATRSPVGSVSGLPGVAENGSYYGEPNANGVPRTAHVDGYTRKDGTYVRGYYRSPPNSNPPKARSGRR